MSGSTTLNRGQAALMPPLSTTSVASRATVCDDLRSKSLLTWFGNSTALPRSLDRELAPLLVGLSGYEHRHKGYETQHDHPRNHGPEATACGRNQGSGDNRAKSATYNGC